MLKKVFQFKPFFYHLKSEILNKTILLVLLIFCFSNLRAQEVSTIKLKIETGILWDWVYGKTYMSGLFLNVEPKLKTSKNTVIGLRIGAAYNTQAIIISEPLEFFIDKNFGSNNAAISFIPTFDYYFSENKYRPYLSLGAGYYFLTTSKDVFIRGNFVDAVELDIKNQTGILFRGGFDLYEIVVGKIDLSKFSFGLEFNYIPKADIETPTGQKIGTITNSNIALSIGYLIRNRNSSR